VGGGGRGAGHTHTNAHTHTHERAACARTHSTHYINSIPPYDDDVFYLFLQKQKIEAKLHIYLLEGTYHKRLFRGPGTNDMRK